MKMIMSFLLLMLAFANSVPSLVFASDVFCQVEMENAAIYSSTLDYSTSVRSVHVLRFDEIKKGLAEIAVKNQQAQDTLYYRVSAKQGGETFRCSVTDVTQLDGSKIEKVKKMAESYKLAIGDSLYYSESEAPWIAFYSNKKVSEDFELNSVKRALGVGLQELEVLTHQEVLEVFESYTVKNGFSVQEEITYKKLLKALLKDFKEIRGFKTGKPDSGARKFFLVGRNEEGQLVGVQTITVGT